MAATAVEDTAATVLLLVTGVVVDVVPTDVGDVDDETFGLCGGGCMNSPAGTALRAFDEADVDVGVVGSRVIP